MQSEEEKAEEILKKRRLAAKGLKERSVVVRHGMRNALLPVVTVIGLSLGAFLSGAILTETIFNLTGMGKTLFEAISGRDYVVVQGVTIVVAVAYLVVNLVVDVSYAFLDPRIRRMGYGRRFLASIPPAPITDDLQAVGRFLGATV